MGVRLGVANFCLGQSIGIDENKLSLRKKLRNLRNLILKSQFSIFDSFRSYIRFFEVLIVSGLWALSERGKLFFGSIDRY